MCNFGSDSSLIIYVRCRNRQTIPRVLFLSVWPAARHRHQVRAIGRIARRNAAPPVEAHPHASHVYPFNAQFPYNLTLRSKRNFAKSFPAAAAAGGGCERDADIGSSRDQMLGQISHSPSLYLKADP